MHSLIPQRLRQTGDGGLGCRANEAQVRGSLPPDLRLLVLERCDEPWDFFFARGPTIIDGSRSGRGADW